MNFKKWLKEQELIEKTNFKFDKNRFKKGQMIDVEDEFGDKAPVKVLSYDGDKQVDGSRADVWNVQVTGSSRKFKIVGFTKRDFQG